MECNEKPNISEVNDAIQRRIIDIPFNSIFTSQDKIDKLKNDNIELTNIFKADRYFKTDDFKNKYKQALFMILIKHFKTFRDNNFNIQIPEIINVRTREYMQNSDAFYNVIEENYIKTNSIKDIVPLKEIYNIFKDSNIYINSTKEQKRKMNYKNFIEKIRTNTSTLPAQPARVTPLRLDINESEWHKSINRMPHRRQSTVAPNAR